MRKAREIAPLVSKRKEKIRLGHRRAPLRLEKLKEAWGRRLG